MLTIVLWVASLVVTWLLAHWYYRRGSRELQSIVDKLPDQLVQKLIAEQRRKLTFEELDQLVSEADVYPTPWGLFPNKCPKCGGEVEVRGSPATEYSEEEAWPVCLECDWRG